MRRTVSTILATALLTSLGALFAAPASAVPPVAVDDDFTVYTGIHFVDVLANDSDPDGDELQVCRVEKASDDKTYFVLEESGDGIVVHLATRAPTVVTITYYACDLETMVPATVTLTVKPVRWTQVRKTDKPGVLRVTNPNDHSTRFRWGTAPFGQFEHVDGRITIPAHDSVLVRVHRHRIDWEARYRHYQEIQGSLVRNIELPKDRSQLG